MEDRVDEKEEEVEIGTPLNREMEIKFDEKEREVEIAGPLDREMEDKVDEKEEEVESGSSDDSDDDEASFPEQDVEQDYELLQPSASILYSPSLN